MVDKSIHLVAFVAFEVFYDFDNLAATFESFGLPTLTVMF